MTNICGASGRISTSRYLLTVQNISGIVISIHTKTIPLGKPFGLCLSIFMPLEWIREKRWIKCDVKKRHNKCWSNSSMKCNSKSHYKCWFGSNIKLSDIWTLRYRLILISQLNSWKHWPVCLHVNIDKNDISMSMRLACFRDRSSEWRHNEHDGVSNHQPRNCLLNLLFRRRSKKT